MSIEFTGNNDYLIRTGEANLGSAANGSALLWFNRNDSAAGADIFAIGKSGNGGLFRTQSSTTIRAAVNTNISSGTDYSLGNGTWVGLAVTMGSDNYYRMYVYEGGSITALHAEDTYGSANVSEIRIGQNGGYYTTCRGYYRYLRFFNRTLSQAEIEAEFQMTPSGGTPAASSTNLFDSWLLGGTSDLTGVYGSTTLSLGGGSTSANEPSIGGGGPPRATKQLLLGVG